MSRRSMSTDAVIAGLLPLALILSGCGEGRDILARVGTHVITVQDFIEVARVNGMQYAGPAEAAREMLLEDMVRRDLMLEAARAHGLDRDTVVTRMRRAVEEQTLTRALFQAFAPKSVPVSDAEVAQLYRWRDTAAHIQLLYTVERSGADAAMTELRRGVPFEQVVSRFCPPGLLPPGGDLGFLTPGSLVDPLDRLLREARVGNLEGPVQAPGEGWFIVRILGRRPNPQPPLEQQKLVLAEMLRQRKQRLLSTRAYQDLRAQYGVRLEPNGPQALFLWTRQMMSLRASGQAAPPLTGEEGATVIARYDDGRGRDQVYTLGQAIADLESGAAERPNLSMLPAIAEWAQDQVIRRVALIEARRRHLDEEPAIRRTIEERVNNEVLEGIFTVAVASQAAVGDSDVLAAYQRNASSFSLLRRVRIARADFADSAAAESLLKHHGHIHDMTLREAAGMVGAAMAEEEVSFPTTQPAWKELQATLTGLAPNDWLGPVRMQGGWTVLQVLSKDQGTQAFESLSPAVRQRLHDEALALKRDQRLAQLTDSLRRAIRPVSVHRDRLRKIPWPVPAADGGS